MPATDVAIVAAFEAIPVVQYTVNVTASPTNGGTVNAGGDYEAGATITLVATANTNWEFVEWVSNGAVLSSNASFVYTVPATDSTVVACFEYVPPEFTLTLSATPASAGQVNAGGSYTEGASVTVYATPNQNWDFTSWTKDGAILSLSPVFEYAMPATDVQLIANFDQATSTTVALRNLSEGTQYETTYYSGFNSNLVIIYPEQIPSLPFPSSYKLVIDGNEYAFVVEAGKYALTLPGEATGGFSRQTIIDNAIIRADEGGAVILLKDIVGGEGVLSDPDNVYCLVNISDIEWAILIQDERFVNENPDFNGLTDFVFRIEGVEYTESDTTAVEGSSYIPGIPSSYTKDELLNNGILRGNTP